MKTVLTGFTFNLGPLKEPLAFIRLLEWVCLLRLFSLFCFTMWPIAWYHPHQNRFNCGLN